MTNESQRNDDTVATLVHIRNSLLALGITGDSLFARIREDLERGLIDEARVQLNVVDAIVRLNVRRIDALKTMTDDRNSWREQNELRVTDCLRLATERDEARAALREAIDCLLAGHGWAQHLDRWMRIANAGAEFRRGAP